MPRAACIFFFKKRRLPILRYSHSLSIGSIKFADIERRNSLDESFSLFNRIWQFLLILPIDRFFIPTNSTVATDELVFLFPYPAAFLILHPISVP